MNEMRWEDGVEVEGGGEKGGGRIWVFLRMGMGVV